MLPNQGLIAQKEFQWFLNGMFLGHGQLQSAYRYSCPSPAVFGAVVFETLCFFVVVRAKHIPHSSNDFDDQKSEIFQHEDICRKGHCPGFCHVRVAH